MPTIVVGILTFISMINTTSERPKARNPLLVGTYFQSAVEIPCSVELSMKKVINNGIRFLFLIQKYSVFVEESLMFEIKTLQIPLE